jgi:hypothetical protein
MTDSKPTDDGEELLWELGAAEGERRVLPAPWDAVVEGRATPAQIAALEAEAAAGDEEVARRLALYRPLDGEAEDALVRALLAGQAAEVGPVLARGAAESAKASDEASAKTATAAGGDTEAPAPTGGGEAAPAPAGGEAAAAADDAATPDAGTDGAAESEEAEAKVLAMPPRRGVRWLAPLLAVAAVVAALILWPGASAPPDYAIEDLSGDQAVRAGDEVSPARLTPDGWLRLVLRPAKAASAPVDARLYVVEGAGALRVVEGADVRVADTGAIRIEGPASVLLPERTGEVTLGVLVAPAGGLAAAERADALPAGHRLIRHRVVIHPR